MKRPREEIASHHAPTAREVVMRLLSTTCRFLRDAIGGFARAMPGRSKAVSVSDERA